MTALTVSTLQATIARAIAKYPEQRGRIERGSALVTLGVFEQLTPDTYAVRSQTDDAVTYSDGTKATHEQEAWDVVNFLMWTAEPHLEARKRTGLQVLIFLIVLAGLLYFTKKKVWHAVELHPEQHP